MSAISLLFLRFNSLALLLLATCLPALGGKPNFIIINIDDLGYADTGPFGSDIPTPNLDRMAKEGRKLMSHYAAPVCSPSRAALMTGCYAKRVLPIPHVLFPESKAGLNPEEKTIAEVLKSGGYVTACIGKWHLGDQPEFLPTKQGFDQFFGLPYSNDMGPASDGAKSSVDNPPGKPKPQAKGTNPEVKVPDTGKLDSQPPLALIEGDQVIQRVKMNEQASLTRLYTERAVQFIKESREQPFLLYLAHTAVHWPYYPSERFRGKSGKGLVADWIQEVDWSVGEVLEALRQAKLDANTLVFFTSDNGGPQGQGKNTPLRGFKGSTLEGGMRVCAIAWWPGKIPADSKTEAITSMMDVLPTFAKLAGANLPASKLDGVDIWPVLVGEPETPPRDHFFYFNGQKLEAVRLGSWKYQLGTSHLFDLAKDSGENKNLAAEHPLIVKKIQSLIDSMKADLGLSGVGPGCRKLGRVPVAEPLIDATGAVNPKAAGEKAFFE